MATDLAPGFTPPGEETPTKYHIHSARLEYDESGGVSFSLTWSYGKDDGEGGYLRIGRILSRSWSGADVVAAVSSPDPGTVNTNLLSIADQLLVADGHIAT